MKKLLIAALCLLAFATCSDDNDEAAKAVYTKRIQGEWYSMTYEKGQTENIRQISSPTGDNPTGQAPIDTYDSFVLRIAFSEDGRGTWTQFFFKDEELINLAGGLYSYFQYSTDADGNITIIKSGNDTPDSTIPSLTHVRYEEEDFILAQFNGTELFFERASTRQQALFVEWQEIYDKLFKAFNGGNASVKTPMTSNNASERSH